MEAAGPSTETQSGSRSSQPPPKKSPKKFHKHARVVQDNLSYTRPTEQSTNRLFGLASTTPGDLNASNNYSKNVHKQTQNDPKIKFGNITTSQNKLDPYHLNDPSIISIIHSPSTSTSPKNNPTQDVPMPGKSSAHHQPAEALRNGVLPTKQLANIKITVHNDQRSIQTEVQQKENPKPFQSNLSELRQLALEPQSNQPQLQAKKSQSLPSAFNTRGPKMPPFQAHTSKSIPSAFNTQGDKQPQFQAKKSQSKPSAFNTQGPQQPPFQAQTSQSASPEFNAQSPIQSQSQAQTPPSQTNVRHRQKKVPNRVPARPGWRAKKPFNCEEQNVERKVIVKGFPAYTQSQELIRKLSVIGTAQVHICKNRVAVVEFKTEAEVAAALRANDTIPMYGAILTVSKYTNQDHVFQMIHQNKRVVRFDDKGPSVVEPSSLDLSGHFQQQLQNLEDAIRLTPAEVEAIGALFHDIETYLRPLYPDCQAVPFGSITTGQGIKSSDADCFLSLEPGENGRPGDGAAEHSSHFVSLTVRVLRQHKDIFTNLVSIPRANTPIIKFLHVPTNINCDLNSKTPLGVQNSRLVGHLLRLDPRLGSAALVLKYWARIHQLSGSGRLTNYALVMLLIQYLQLSVLPPVAKLQGPEHRFIVESWDAGFDRTPLPYLRDVRPVQDILGGFFSYYSIFNFEELVVSPLLGKPLKKADFINESLPREMELYISNINSGMAYPLRTGCAMCVQDPFELSHNVASSISVKLAADIQTHFKWAAAAYAEPEKIPGDFLRTILLSSPPIDESDALIGSRLAMPGRLLDALGEGVEGGWRAEARAALLDVVYSHILLLPLERRPAVSREADVEIEVYVGTLTRPVWRRVGHRNGRMRNLELLTSRHRVITEEIVKGPEADVHMPFEVELGFSESPRRLTVTTTPTAGANLEAFRMFRMFAHNFIHRWCKMLLTREPTPNPIAPSDAPKQEIKPANIDSRDMKKSETSDKPNSLAVSMDTVEEKTSDTSDGKPSSDDRKPNSDDGKPYSDDPKQSSNDRNTNSENGKTNSDGGKPYSDDPKQSSNDRNTNSENGKTNSDGGKPYSDDPKQSSNDRNTNSENEKTNSDDGKPRSDEYGTSNSSQDMTKPLEESKVNSQGGSSELLKLEHLILNCRTVLDSWEKRKNSLSSAHSTLERSISAPGQIASETVNTHHKGVSLDGHVDTS